MAIGYLWALGSTRQVDLAARNLHQQMKLPAGALNQLDESALCPGTAQLERINPPGAPSVLALFRLLARHLGR